MKSMILMLALLGACSGAQRVVPCARLDALREEAMKIDSDVGIENKTSKKIDEDTIAKVREFDRKPEFPGKVAVVRIARNGEAYVPAAPTEKELRPFVEALGKNDRVQSVEAVSSLLLPARADLVSLRYSAARIGARYLFIYMTDAQHDTGWTGAANLNFLIVPFLLVPSHEVYAAAAAEGILVDAYSNAVYLSVNSFKDDRTVYWNLAGIDDPVRRTKDSLTDEALKSLAADFNKRLSGLK